MPATCLLGQHNFLRVDFFTFGKRVYLNFIRDSGRQVPNQGCYGNKMAAPFNVLRVTRLYLCQKRIVSLLKGLTAVFHRCRRNLDPQRVLTPSLRQETGEYQNRKLFFWVFFSSSSCQKLCPRITPLWYKLLQYNLHSELHLPVFTNRATKMY